MRGSAATGRAPQARRRPAGAWILCGPGLAWLAGFVLVPLALVLGVSLLSRGEYGEIQLPLTLENYRRLGGWTELGFDPVYPRVVLRTVLVSALVTVLALGLALPLAFFIARLRPRARGVALTLVVIPFWTNLLIRTYAWQLLLAAGGPVARLASALGLADEGVALYPGWGAVVAAMLCDFLPFMVLPVYASVEKIDWTLAEAAADLGAGAWRVFRHALWPQIVPGVRAGVVLVFLPATGQFVIPDLLGGGQTTLLGNLVQQQFGPSRDWPFGAALAAVALAILAGLSLLRRRRAEAGEEAPWP